MGREREGIDSSTFGVKGGYPLSPARGAPRTGGCVVGGLIPISRRIISAEARPTAALLPPCGDKRVGGALFNYGGIGRGPAVGVGDQGVQALISFPMISALPSSPSAPPASDKGRSPSERCDRLEDCWVSPHPQQSQLHRTVPKRHDDLLELVRPL